MSFLYSYISSYIYGNNDENYPKISYTEKKYLITVADLQNVNLIPLDNIVPGPARNMPPKYDKVNLQALNKAQLLDILSVKLKPTKVNEKTKSFAPRHPVVRELYYKFNNK